MLFTYVGTHLLNHSLGNISLAWLERGLLVQKFIWQGWLGTAVLYSALVTHFFLGLWALYGTARVALDAGRGGAARPRLVHTAAASQPYCEYADRLCRVWPGQGLRAVAVLVLDPLHRSSAVCS
ncbi:hypothetical protein ACU4GD_17670 [Cupriavidus basilensis]